MSRFTFGFMNETRNPETNKRLFAQFCDTAVQSFRNAGVADLDGMLDAPPEKLDKDLGEDAGIKMGKLRDAYFADVSRRQAMVQFPELQSLFVYSFTIGMLPFSAFLLDPKDFTPPAAPSMSDIYGRRFQAVGPKWLSAALDRETVSVQDVFCDFQNEMIVPIAKDNPSDMRLIADVIAGSLAMAHLGGGAWFRELVTMIADATSLGRPLTPGEPCMVQAKRSMQMLDADEIMKVKMVRMGFRK